MACMVACEQGLLFFFFLVLTCRDANVHRSSMAVEAIECSWGSTRLE